MTKDDEPLPIVSALLPDLRLTYRVGDALEITTSAVHPPDAVCCDSPRWDDQRVP